MNCESVSVLSAYADDIIVIVNPFNATGNNCDHNFSSHILVWY